MSGPGSSRLPKLSRRSFLRTSSLGLAAMPPLSAALAPSAFAATGRSTDTVRLSWSVGALPHFAKARGEFEKTLARDGIKLEWVGPFVGHAASLQALVGGSVDFTFGGSSSVAFSTLLAGSPLLFTLSVDTKPRNTAILTRQDTGIERVEDLVGRTVAVNRSGLGEFLLVAALEKHRIDRSKVKVVFLNPPDAGPAFRAGKIDAWSTWGISADIARTDKATRDLFLESRDLDYQIDYPSIVSTRRFVQDNPDLVRALNAALAAEAQWVSQNTVQAEHLLQKVSNYSDEIRDRYIAQKRHVEVRSVSDPAFLERLQKSADWLLEHRILNEKLVVANHVARV